MEIAEWIERYRQAWESADADAAAGLFTEDATYRSNPFRPPHRGRAAIHAYWISATESQSNVKVTMGRPVVDGRKVVVEWWTEMDDDGSPVTLPGALILDFNEQGLCTALREYYNILEGERMAAPSESGT
jgi:ketosteroid isomerase-like protein